MDDSKSISQFTVRHCHFEQYHGWFLPYIQFLSSLTEITSLHIELKYFSIDILVRFLNQLYNLDSLTIVFLSSNQIVKLTEEQFKMIHQASKMNKITKMNIISEIELNQIDILMNLCPQMEYLHVKCRNYMELECIIRLILMKRKSNLYLLCFWISKADDQMVKKLQTMIYLEKLIVNYRIQRIHNRIYLQW
jgi:hypothetical protein